MVYQRGAGTGYPKREVWTARDTDGGVGKDIKNDSFIFRQIIYLKNIQKYCMKSIELIQ